MPVTLASQVDVMTGVLPYVPDDALHLLPRDVQRYEPRIALDGGEISSGISVRKLLKSSPRKSLRRIREICASSQWIEEQAGEKRGLR